MQRGNVECTAKITQSCRITTFPIFHFPFQKSYFFFVSFCSVFINASLTVFDEPFVVNASKWHQMHSLFRGKFSRLVFCCVAIWHSIMIFEICSFTLRSTCRLSCFTTPTASSDWWQFSATPFDYNRMTSFIIIIFIRFAAEEELRRYQQATKQYVRFSRNLCVDGKFTVVGNGERQQ